MVATPISAQNQPSESILEMAADLQIDALLESSITADVTIRFICGVRKSLLEAPQAQTSPELVQAERLLTRLYHHIGYERRNLAFRNCRRD